VPAVPDWSSTRAAFTAAVASAPGGAALAVHHRGELVLDLWGGEGWGRDTLVMGQSTTKGVVATAAHLLVSDGLLDVDAPVSAYWPEFGKPSVTVRHLLTHAAGLHKIRHRVTDLGEVYDWDRQVRELEQQEPAWEPGTRWGYHALTYGWLVGEVLQRASGERVDDLVAARLAGPLGADGLFLGLPAGERHRVARCRFRHGPLPGSCLPRGSGRLTTDERAMEVPVPAIGGFFTARSLAAMYAMLAAGGTWQGRQLVAPEVVRAAAEVHSRGRDKVMRVPLEWRLGYHRVRGAKAVLPDAFGHYGFGGSGAWADPRNELAVGFTCNGSGSLVERRVPRLVDALLEDLATA
jgi:CubicO group peptidase (beta-lactamase class C family)